MKCCPAQVHFEISSPGFSLMNQSLSQLTSGVQRSYRDAQRGNHFQLVVFFLFVFFSLSQRQVGGERSLKSVLKGTIKYTQLSPTHY